MNRVTVVLSIVIVLIGALVLAARSTQLSNLLFRLQGNDSSGAMPLASGFSPIANDENTSQVVTRVEPWISGLQVPWSLVFTSPNRVLVTERPGRVRVVQDGQLQAQAVHTFDEVRSSGEQGFMGMTMDPNYGSNKYLYFSLAYTQGGQSWVKIVRMTDEGTRLSNETVILDRIPSATNHAGNRLKFGPDGKLYSSTGDASDRDLAQDPNSLAGKILRLNSDGSIPADNPFPNSLIYSLGHRNPQGFDWNPETGDMWATEHGPSGFDGPGGGDEINLITAGSNYGWPIVSHERSQAGMVSPSLVFTPAIAPAAGMWYSSDVMPQFKNNFFVAMLRGQGILRVAFNENDKSKVAGYETMPNIEVGRVREIIQGPDGYIYFTTSNQDGRGTVREGDDHIYRILPE